MIYLSIEKKEKHSAKVKVDASPVSDLCCGLCAVCREGSGFGEEGQEGLPARFLEPVE